jgi:hypothetical protein
LGQAFKESVEPLMDSGSENLQRFVERFNQRENLKGTAVYDAAGTTLAISSGLAPLFKTRPAAAARAAQLDAGYGEFLQVHHFHATDGAEILPIHIYALPLHRDDKTNGTLVLIHDTSYLDAKVAGTMRDSLLNAFVQTVLAVSR